MFGIALKGREFYLLRKVNVLRQEKWERRNCELVSTPTGSEFADQTIAVSLSQELKKIGPYNEKKKLEVMQDTGLIDFELVAPDFESVPLETLEQESLFDGYRRLGSPCSRVSRKYVRTF